MTPKSERLALASCTPPQHQAVAANVANVLSTLEQQHLCAQQ